MKPTGEGRERPLPIITRLYHVRKSSNLSPEMQEMVRSPLRRSLWDKASHGNEPIKHVFHHSPSRRVYSIRCNTRQKVTKWPTFRLIHKAWDAWQGLPIFMPPLILSSNCRGSVRHDFARSRTSTCQKRYQTCSNSRNLLRERSQITLEKKRSLEA
jgi:hypothetical protein